MRELSAHFIALAKKQRAKAPLMIGARLMGISLLSTGASRKGERISTAHVRFTIPPNIDYWRRGRPRHPGSYLIVSVVGPMGAWLSPGCAADTENALQDAREIGQAASLGYALFFASETWILCGNYITARYAR